MINLATIFQISISDPSLRCFPSNLESSSLFHPENLSNPWHSLPFPNLNDIIEGVSLENSSDGYHSFENFVFS